MDRLTIVDLIANGTLSADQAAILWTVVEEQCSFVVVAIPRFAGKSTITKAIFDFLPPTVPVHRLSGQEEEMDRLKEEATGGYLVVAEFSKAPVPSYIWGAPVLKVFDTMTAGYALATALHASGIDEAFTEICSGNGVSDEAASRIDFMLYIRRFGEDKDDYWRRLSELYEVDHVLQGKPQGHLLSKWDEKSDQFVAVREPSSLHIDSECLVQRASLLQKLADAGNTGVEEIAKLLLGQGPV